MGDTGGQNLLGGGSPDDLRRRLGDILPGAGGGQARPVPFGSQNPTPPSGPRQSAAPVQQGGMTPTTPQGGPGSITGGADVGNPYVNLPQGGVGPKTFQGDPLARGGQTAQPGMPETTTVKPGAPIGPGSAPAPSAGGQTSTVGPRRQLGPAPVPQTAPSPGNPSPAGPRGNAGPIIRSAGGAPQGGGWQRPNWGGPTSGSPGLPNVGGFNPMSGSNPTGSNPTPGRIPSQSPGAAWSPQNPEGGRQPVQPDNPYEPAGAIRRRQLGGEGGTGGISA